MAQVLIVEDSVTSRRFLANLVNNAPGMVVVGEASDGIEAIQMTKDTAPDVISMDLRMPRMDGLEAIRQIMQQHPTPIVAVSSILGQTEIDMAMLAMEAGAVAALEKPTAAPEDETRRREFLRMLHLMASVKVIRRYRENSSAPVPDHFSALIKARTTQPEIVVVGASAGGPGALAVILEQISIDFPLPILIVQHLSADFVPGLVDWLDRRCPLPIRLAEEGEFPRAGQVLFAPGGKHMTVNGEGRIVLRSDKGDYRHQPSVDMLFSGVAQVYGSRAIGVLLTGMGDDGAQGMAQLRAAGARTLAQNEETSVVFGMPAAAIALDAVEYVLPVEQIAAALYDLTQPLTHKEQSAYQ